MDSSKRSISARGKGILSLALAKLETDPPAVLELPISEMCDPAVYRKTIGDNVVEEMRKRGYKVEAPPQWTADYEAHMALVDRLKGTDTQQEEFEQSIKRAKERLEQMKIDAGEDSAKSDEEWEDVDTSYGSNKSISSKGATRSSNMLNAKKSLKQMMQDSAKKGATQSSTLEQNRSMKVKNNSSNDLKTSKGDRLQRGVKRQASSVLASDAKKDKKSIEVDKTEFARSQNSRVQLVKERKEMKDKERNELMKAKIQQKQTATKETKASKKTKNAQKSSTASAKSLNTAPVASAVSAAAVKKSAVDKHASGTFSKPAAPPAVAPPAASAGKILPLDGSFCTDSDRFASMQSKAFEDRRHGGLAKQAMYQSILASGDDNRSAVNSTFLPGVESKPDFDASLALKGMKDTFVVGSAMSATFVSKPGLIQTPVKLNPQKEASFLDSFNETFRDYGLDDLCSDSDNTDDENAPTKPVPKWADLKSARFKERVSRQRMLGNDITKYGMKNVYMPPSVDLEMIFEEKSNRFDRHDTSSGIWNATQDFIKH